jgi:hypothetical protein
MTLHRTECSLELPWCEAVPGEQAHPAEATSVSWAGTSSAAWSGVHQGGVDQVFGEEPGLHFSGAYHV